MVVWKTLGRASHRKDCSSCTNFFPLGVPLFRKAHGMTSSLLWMRWCTKPSNRIVGCPICSINGSPSPRGSETNIVVEIRKLKDISKNKQVSAYGEGVWLLEVDEKMLLEEDLTKLQEALREQVVQSKNIHHTSHALNGSFIS